MAKYIFIYGIYRDKIKEDDCCSIRFAKALCVKLLINEKTNTPSLKLTNDIYDYVRGEAIKICNDKRFVDVIQQIDSFAVGFSRKIIQVSIDWKKKPVYAYAYFVNNETNYKEIDAHSYSEWCDRILSEYEIIDKNSLA
jgi:hypothetical protein